MKLKSAHVTNFRSILDSGQVDIEASTCLVGKNEAGKTAFLKALEGALLHKALADRSAPFPGHSYPTVFVTGMPSAL